MGKNSKTRRLTHGNSNRKVKTLGGLVVISHPDDETLFMLAPILKRTAHRSARKSGEVRCSRWTIVCVTDANGNGEGKERMRLFAKACRELGASFIALGHPDIFDQHINEKVLQEQLLELSTNWTAVYTHGPLGEYGHPHHQGVSLAVHQVFSGHCPVWSVANNVAAELTVTLTAAQFKRKTDILMKYYHDEIRKFLNLIPVFAHEAYCRLDTSQVHAIQAAANGELVPAKSLGPYQWLYSILTSGDWSAVASRFFKIYFHDESAGSPQKS